VAPGGVLARARPIAGGPVKIVPRRLKNVALSLNSDPMSNFGMITQTAANPEVRKAVLPSLPYRARKGAPWVAAPCSALEVLCSERLQKKY
jgi:hypothetical protein